jgi:hypothetical protein
MNDAQVEKALTRLEADWAAGTRGTRLVDEFDGALLAAARALPDQAGRVAFASEYPRLRAGEPSRAGARNRKVLPLNLPKLGKIEYPQGRKRYCRSAGCEFFTGDYAAARMPVSQGISVCLSRSPVAFPHLGLSRRSPEDMQLLMPVAGGWHMSNGTRAWTRG